MSCECRKVSLALNKEVLTALIPRQPLNNSLLPIRFVHLAHFSVFNKLHMRAAMSTASRLASLPVSELLGTLGELKSRHPASPHVEYLLRAALWKHQDTRHLTLPPSHQTNPALYFSQGLLAGGLQQKELNPQKLGLELDPEQQPGLELDPEQQPGLELDPEQKLRVWREDPGLAEHHHNWHVYYPHTEPPKDRQGELFAYMHLQMLARYDFERLSVGLGRVRAFGPGYCWDKPLKQGYNTKMRGLSFRPSNISIGETFRYNDETIHIDEMGRIKDLLFYGLAREHLEAPDGSQVKISMNDLGNTVESNEGSVNKRMYGDIHNRGHQVLATITDPDGRFGVAPGPMVRTETAPRDPVFYRWHKFIDAVFEAHRASLEPYTRADLWVKDIEIASFSVQSDSKGMANSERNTLYTFFEKKKYVVYNPTEKTITKQVLNHLPYNLKIKVSNCGSQDALLVFRIFISPSSNETLDQWRNTFIELDKFVEKIGAGSELEITRSDTDSSVILPPDVLVRDIQAGRVPPGGPGCGCGWPANLLVPRGNTTGLKADLYVLATDWQEDAVDPSSPLPRTVSYCGKTGSPYPDKRPMGFPFDRATNSRSLEGLTRGVPNSRSARVKVTHLENGPGSVEREHEDERTKRATESNGFIIVG